MTSINFRLYGDQIYGLTQKYLTEYISPEIIKDKGDTRQEHDHGEHDPYDSVFHKGHPLLSFFLQLRRFFNEGFAVVLDPFQNDRSQFIFDHPSGFFQIWCSVFHVMTVRP